MIEPNAVEPFLPLVMQGGSMAILGYLVFWVTKNLAPKLIEALFGIKSAMETHTVKLEQLERTNARLAEVVTNLAKDTKSIGEETLTAIKSNGNH